MTLGASVAQANAYLTDLAALATHVKPHTGDPGAAGAGNAAAETDRAAVSWDTPSLGAMDNDATVDWTAVAATETWTHFSLWTASSGGTFLHSGTLTGMSVTSGGNAQLDIGDLVVTVTTLAG